MNPEQHDRNAAMFARMGHQTNGNLPMAPPMAPMQRPSYGAPAGSGIRPIPRPTPPKIPPVDRLTGPNTKIPNKMDPANRYNNVAKEKAVGDASSSDLTGVNSALTLVLLTVIASSVFVINEKYRFFWLVIFGLGVIMMMGNRLYSDLYAASIDVSNSDEEQKTKYANFAGGVLYAMFILFAVVMTCILLVLIWKVYGQVSARSNLVSNKEAPAVVEEEEVVVMQPAMQPAMQQMSKKELKRMRRKQMQNMF